MNLLPRGTHEFRCFTPADPFRVWTALTDGQETGWYLYGLVAESSWCPDAPIRFRAPPHLPELAELWMSILHAEIVGPARAAMNAMGSEGFRRSFTDTAACLPALDGEGYQAAWRRRHAILREWSLFFETFAVVLTPTSCQPTFPVDYDTRGLAAMAEMLSAYAPLSAIAGAATPAISAPVGFAAGAPAGVQIVAAPFREERCLAAAAALERRMDPLLPIDPKAA